MEELSSTFTSSKFRTDPPRTYEDKKMWAYATKTLQNLRLRQKKLEQSLQKNGKVKLAPGQSYSFTLRSFCVHVGKERPIAGDGFRFGPMKGTTAKWLPDIIRQYQSQGISQERAQRLIWSLLSGNRFDELEPKQKNDLLKIFPNAAIQFGNRYLEEEGRSFLESLIPSQAQEISNELMRLREVSRDTRRTYNEIAEIMAPFTSRTEPITMGWVKIPEGYLARVSSNESYSSTIVDLYVPNNISRAPTFDPLKLVAIPGTGQRLAISPNADNDSSNSSSSSSSRESEVPKSPKGPNITDEELDLIKNHPVDAAIVALNAYRARRETSKIFPNMKTVNTPADVFRHFLWSALNAKKIGSERALEFLRAHESEQFKTKPREAAMDMWNNKQGVLAAERLGKDASIDNFTQEALKKIEDGTLITNPNDTRAK